MPRNTYGDTVKKRVKRLLEALLAFVNWEFEGNFDIEFKWEAEDSTNPKLIVKTTLVTLEWLIEKDKYPDKLTKTQIREALKLLKDFLKILEDNRTQTRGVDTWHFTLTLWSKDREKNLKQFDKAWEDSRPEKSKALEANFKKSDAFDWRNICLAMLEAEKPLTTNALMRYEDDRFELEEIHVPLALVERKKPNLIGGDTQAEQGSRLYEPEYEEKQRFEHEQFLLDILTEGKGKHNGKRIAIIGEPGAGKTTLLRKIAFWVQENTEILPISISLADLPETNSQQQFLEQYLLDKWLPAALPYFSPEIVEVTEALKTELKKLCNQGRVWLLLDGVDEMPVQGEERLWAISNQLKGWVGQARVVLTCRLNVWEANRNVLADNFEIYHTLDFSYGDSTTPDRVGEFIAKWFNKTPNLGQELRQELDKPGKERIKDLVKNPLRLALLCSTWNWWRDRGGLPDTKAKLYQGFVEKFYDWKGKEFPTNYTQREKLNRALGELAKLAIDQTESRFRLKHSLVCHVLGQPDEELFGLALKLGWLNEVGLATESPDEKVYAFWHPTFEEYFAACEIKDWHFFLNHVPQNPKLGIYRIFEQQWKEVMLLWLGREEIAQYQKEELIKTLLNFEDGCGQFYLHLARLVIFHYLYEFGYLNKVAIEAFIDCELTKNLDTFLRFPAKYIKGLLRLYEDGPVGGLNFDLREWLASMPEVFLIEEEVNMRLGDLTFLSLPESFLIEREMSLNQSNLIIKALKHINSTDDINTLIQYLNLESKQAICVTKFGNKLEENMIVLEMEFNEEAEQESDIRREAMIRLMEISRNDPTPVAAAASQAIYTSQNSHTRRLLTWLLGEIAPGNLTVFNSLVYLLHTSQDKLTRVGAIDSLQKVIQRGNLLQAMVEKLKNNLTAQVYKNDSDLYNECFRILLYYTQTMPYPDFYQAWHQDTLPDSATASLNLANLPQILAEAINNQPDLCSKIKLICIDSHQFIDPDNPAQEIYDEILNQNCPEWQNGYPDTMQKLKLYWNSLRRQSEIPLFFICYDSTALSATPTGFSDSFLKALSKFDRAICVVCEQGNIPLPTFSPSQPDLVPAVVAWIRRSILENRHPI